ncbi:MAG: hypothetical protein QXO35_03805 [Candidatus Micrarchaeia archaeon]
MANDVSNQPNKSGSKNPGFEGLMLKRTNEKEKLYTKLYSSKILSTFQFVHSVA